MYKALDVRDNTEVVILDPKWLRSISQLRELDHHDFLVCQGCKQPVRVRAGEQRREHFAHKHLENCNYSDESAILRNSRAVLYEWLVSKFGENVTIEKQVDGTDLFRPIDCWVTQDSKVFAYWIFDSTINPEKRMALQYSAKKLGVEFHWVFALNMFRTEQDNPDKLVLSTTEREFIQRSKYDAFYASGYSATNGSLHYIDTENRRLITFRGLSLYHEPQIYKGYNLTSELEKVLVSPQNGEFVHDGEHEKLQKYEQRLKAIDDSPNKRWERFAFQRNPDFFNQSLKDSAEREETKVPVEISVKQSSEKIYPSGSLLTKTGKCEFCGEITDDWWSYDGKTGLCKCRSCLKQGKS